MGNVAEHWGRKESDELKGAGVRITFEAVFAEGFVDGNGILPIETGQAKGVPGDTCGLHQIVDVQIAQAVQACEIANLLHRLLCGDELPPG